MEQFPKPDEEMYSENQDRLLQFSELRKRVHKESHENLEKRLKENPTPSEQELMVGAFREEIESQVREALFAINQKGYATESSGFGGTYGEIQAIDGYFLIDAETRKKLSDIAVSVVTDSEKGWWRKNYTTISFKPKAPTLENIAAVWKQIADVLPSKENIQPSISGRAAEFRIQYGAGHRNIELQALERELKLVGPENIEPSVLADKQNRMHTIKKELGLE
mgnify:FL=1